MRLFRWFKCTQPTAALTNPDSAVAAVMNTATPAPVLEPVTEPATALADEKQTRTPPLPFVRSLTPRTVIELHPEYAHSEPYRFTASAVSRQGAELRHNQPVFASAPPTHPGLALRSKAGSAHGNESVSESLRVVESVSSSPEHSTKGDGPRSSHITTQHSSSTSNKDSPTEDNKSKKPHEDTISYSRLSISGCPQEEAPMRRWRGIMRRPLEQALRRPVSGDSKYDTAYRGRLSMCAPSRTHVKDSMPAKQRLSLSDMPQKPVHEEVSFHDWFALQHGKANIDSVRSDLSSANSDDQTFEPETEDRSDSSAFFGNIVRPMKTIVGSATQSTMSSSSSLSVSTILPLVGYPKRSFGRMASPRPVSSKSLADDILACQTLADDQFADAEDDAGEDNGIQAAEEEENQMSSFSNQFSESSNTSNASVFDDDGLLPTEVHLKISVSSSSSDNSSEYQAYSNINNITKVPLEDRSRFEDVEEALDTSPMRLSSVHEERFTSEAVPVQPSSLVSELTTVSAATIYISGSEDIDPDTPVLHNPSQEPPSSLEGTLEHPSFARTIAQEMRAKGLSPSRKTSMSSLHWRSRDDGFDEHAEDLTRSLGAIPSFRRAESGFFKRILRAATRRGTAVSRSGLRNPGNWHIDGRRASLALGESSYGVEQTNARRNSCDAPAVLRRNGPHSNNYSDWHPYTKVDAASDHSDRSSHGEHGSAARVDEVRPNSCMPSSSPWG